MRNIEKIKCNILVGQGKKLADLVLKNVRIFHLVSGEFEVADLAVSGKNIVGIGADYHGTREIDCSGLTAVPGFIDSHLHVESSMIRPYEFERYVMPHGTTTGVCDPHELTNVAGTKAFDYFFDCAAKMKMSLYPRISSCVPSTPFETAGYAIGADDVKEYSEAHPDSGLAEVMNVPGVLNAAPDLLAKLAYFDVNAIDGHAPLLSGKDLNGYVAAGIRNDHECSNLDEAREKLRRGMNVLIREGSVARNLDALMPLITLENSLSISFCTDDRNPLDIEESGHIDSMIRRALESGCNPLAVYRAASWSAARNFGFNDYGLLAPGYRADIVLLSNFETCNVHAVLKHGEFVDDAMFAKRPAEPSAACFYNSIYRNAVVASDFAKKSNSASTRVIGIQPMSLITDDLKCELPKNANDELLPDLENDIIKIAVLERYGKNGNLACGFVKGSGISNGAIASSVGHDSHNICVIGSDDEQIALAVNQLIEQQGGFVVVASGKVVETLPLPLGGLMSDQPAEYVARQLKAMKIAAAATGCTLTEPFLQLAFLPLPVIPFLKITDMGVINTVNMQFVE